MNSWKKRWKNELDEITPKMRGEVRNTPLPSNAAVQKNGAVVLSRNSKIWISVIAFALCAVIVGLIIFVPSASKPQSSLFVVEINPSATFSADKNGNVCGVIANNADADIVLSREDIRKKIIGQDVKTAIKIYADYASRLGFVHFDGSSAVRVSMLGENGDLLDGVQSTLKDYFMGKGVFAVVFAETVDITEFSARSGIAQDSLNAADVIKYVEEQPTLYSVRCAQNMEIKDAQKLYGEAVERYDILNAICDSVKNNAETLRQNAVDMRNLFDLHGKIYSHKDNPAVLFKDYWSVSKYYGKNDFSEEFGALMEEMTNALNVYSNKYGVNITGAVQLAQLAEDYSKLSAEKIIEIAENFTKDAFYKYYDILGDVLEAAGALPSEAAELARLPQTMEEYFSKTETVLAETFSRKLNDFSAAYGTERTPLTKEDSSSFENAVISQYGSLSEFWNSEKK